MKKSLYDYCIEREEFQILAQWDKDKNEGLTPHNISYGNRKKVWWRCEQGHQWEAAVYTRASRNTGCPYCTGRKLESEYNSLAIKYPNIAEQWDTSKNGDLMPTDVTPGSHQKVWWVCEKGHEWQAQIRSRISGRGCPICAGQLVAPGANDLSTTRPDLAAQWHCQKNGTLTPEQVTVGSHQKVWWICDKGHEWRSIIYSRSKEGAGCPVCAGKQVVAGENDLASSFPEIAEQWHPTKNGVLTPQTINIYSNKKAWWICKLGHEYTADVRQRTFASSGCPYCVGTKVLVGFNDLATKEPKIAAQWHAELNGTLTPEQVTVGSKKKVWWQCADGHAWKAVIYSRTGTQKHGCPVCAGRVKKPRNFEIEF